MRKDIFNNACYNANGDILSATGDITGTACILNAASPKEIAQLRSEVQRTKTQLAIEETKVADLEHRASACQKAAGFRCKKKYGASKNQLYDMRNAARVVRDGAKKAYEAASANLNEAQKILDNATKDFTACQKAEQEKAIADAEAKRQADLVAVEQSKVDVEQSKVVTEQQKVGVTQLEAGKDYFKYGLVGIGAIVVLILGYKMVNK